MSSKAMRYEDDAGCYEILYYPVSIFKIINTCEIAKYKVGEEKTTYYRTPFFTEPISEEISDAAN